MDPLPRPGDQMPELPGSVSLVALWQRGSAKDRWRVLGGWWLTLVMAVGLGMLSARWQWSGMPIQLGGGAGEPGMQLHLTLYPPLTLCLWWTLCFGWRWGAPTAFLAMLALALDAGIAPVWAAVLACASPIGLGVMALGYRAIGAPRSLRSVRAWMFYVPLSFVSAMLSSVGALLWTHANHLDPASQLALWQGWWVGAFLQSVLLTGPLMMLTWPAVWRWLRQRPGILHPPTSARRSLGLGLLLAMVLAVLGFGLVNLGLGSLQLRQALSTGQWQELEDAARVMLSTAWVFFWVFALIVLFVAQFGYQALSRFLRSTEALVSQLAQVNAELEERSRTDGLTGLANRAAAEEGLHALLRTVRRYGTPAAVLMLDIDLFKQVNDQHGHAAGDAVIRDLAGLLKDASRDVDLTGRFGGEEFVIGLAHTDGPGAWHFAERLRERVARHPVHWEQQTLSYTVSIGVSPLRADDAGIEDALRRADTALYRAKEAGRNRVQTEPQIPHQD